MLYNIAFNGYDRIGLLRAVTLARQSELCTP